MSALGHAADAEDHDEISRLRAQVESLQSHLRLDAIGALSKAVGQDDKRKPVIWRSWSDKDGYGFWDTQQEARLYSAHDYEPEPLYTSQPMDIQAGWKPMPIDPTRDMLCVWIKAQVVSNVTAAGLYKDMLAVSPRPPEVKVEYPLPDDLYDSKDWRSGSYFERVEWLHVMYESAKDGIARLEENAERRQEALEKIASSVDIDTLGAAIDCARAAITNATKKST